VYLQVKMSASTLLDARTSLAANPGILPRVQLLLARCPDDLARMALARNPALTQEAAEVLAWDEDLEVSRQALRNASVELTGTMALHLHRWRPSYFGGSSSSAAYQALSRRLPNRVLESLVGSHGRTWSFDDLLAFTDAASRLDPETLEVLLDGFTGTPAELLELASELGPTALPV
jgi:choline dehydrogenase-like flavoprotein